jgi:hypothetical protein
MTSRCRAAHSRTLVLAFVVGTGVAAHIHVVLAPLVDGVGTVRAAR